MNHDRKLPQRLTTAENNRIRLLTVDDHPILREGLRTIIQSQPDLLLVAETGTGREALALFQQHQPDVLLLDLRLPDLHGIEVITAIRALQPGAKIIVLTTYLADVQVLRALRAGASGFLLKASLRRDLVAAIHAVQAGERMISPEVAVELAQHAGDPSLTEREITVLQEVGAGCSNKLIADRLHISEETVKGHLRSIMAKLKARDRTHAVTIALRRGFLDL